MKLTKYSKFFLIAILILYLLSVVVFFIKEKEKKDLYRTQKLESLESEYLVALNGSRMLSDFIFEQIVNSSRVQSIMAGACDNPDDRTRLRQELLSQLSPLYGQLAILHFRQLHFHLPDSSSFLRFHRPMKFGDSLVGVRETVVAANTTLKRVSGFEEGRIYNGFRFVYPLFNGQEHVGSVEISSSSAALMGELSRVFGKQYRFLLDRQVVGQKVIAEELKNYGSSLLSPGLLHDREVHEGSCAVSNQIPAKIIDTLSVEVAQQFYGEIAAWQSVVYLSTIQGHRYVVGLVPVSNFNGENVAYLVSYEEDKFPLALSGNFFLAFVLLTLVFAGGLVFFLHIVRVGNKLEIISATDFLTGIWNRGKGYELLQHEHNRALRYDTHYALIMFDVDHFKDVNDGYGHPVGDYVLRQLVSIVGDVSRRTDSLCRWGGEEFLLLLPETSLEHAVLLAEKIRVAISNYAFKYVGTVTVSLGVTECAGKTLLVDEVLGRVDEALYEAKRSGRNMVCQSPFL